VDIKQRAILLVENELQLTGKLKQKLQNEGYQVITANDGENAISIVSEEDTRVDLILIDVELGKDLDGIGTARTILNEHNIPLLFLLDRNTGKDIIKKTEKIRNCGYIDSSSPEAVLDASIRTALRLFDAEHSITPQTSQYNLQDRKNLYKSFFHNINSSSSLYDVIYDENGSPCDYRYITVNPYFETATGYKKSFLKGKTLLEVFPRTEPAWLEAFKKVVLTNKPAVTENYSIELDEYFELTIFVPQKGQLAFIGNNITREKQIKEALHNREKLLKASQNLSNSGAWEWDVEKKSMIWTDEVYRIHEIDPETLPGNSKVLIEKGITCYRPEDQSRVLEAFSNCAEHGRPYDLELPFTTFKGREIWIRTTARAELSAGRVVKVIGMIMDITAKKAAEDKINNLLKDKELILREVHHRIINNMKTMSALLQLKSDFQKNKEASVILQDAAGQIHSMLVLYKKLYTSDDFRQLSLKIYIPSLVEEIINIFQLNESIDIQTQIEDISLDAQFISPLGIIINELITNSIKYAFNDESGNPQILLRVSTTGRLLYLEYQDNGAGIPESVSFDNSTGFGLQLVNMLVKQINGSIRIEREKGTKFVIEFEF